MGLASTLTIR